MYFAPLHTPRLSIRRFCSADGPAVYAYTSIASVMTYIPEGCLSQDQAQAFVEDNSTDQARAAAVILSAENTLIGHIIFHPWFAHQTYEIGWVFNPRYYGHGYATEAARALRDYGFEVLGLHRIIATCQPENIASYHIMEKLGMRREAHFRQCIFRDNALWWDEFFYAILREEWRTYAQ